MTSDDTRHTQDVKFRIQGSGERPTFTCAQCNKEQGTHGRRMQKVKLGAMRGMRSWVCGQCAES